MPEQPNPSPKRSNEGEKTSECITVVTVIFPGEGLTGATRTLGESVTLAVDKAPKSTLGKRSRDPLGHLVSHGNATDGEKTPDDVAVSAPKVFPSHMGEDAAETLAYGGRSTSKVAPCATSVSGVATVEVGEPIKCVPPNGKSDPIKVESTTGSTLVESDVESCPLCVVYTGKALEKTDKTESDPALVDVLTVVHLDHFDEDTEGSNHDNPPVTS